MEEKIMTFSVVMATPNRTGGNSHFAPNLTVQKHVSTAQLRLVEGGVPWSGFRC